MTAIQVMRRDLMRTQRLMNECISEAGFVYQSKKYEYQDLVRKADELQWAIMYLENMYKARGTVCQK